MPTGERTRIEDLLDAATEARATILHIEHALWSSIKEYLDTASELDPHWIGSRRGWRWHLHEVRYKGRNVKLRFVCPDPDEKRWWSIKLRPADLADPRGRILARLARRQIRQEAIQQERRVKVQAELEAKELAELSRLLKKYGRLHA